ncbi:MAG: hypothetical protein O9248_01525 [Rhodobacteraceae bacterium]|nr:hypothetical protein [Paracoccaceae bacterium]
MSARATPAQESLRKGQFAKPRAFLRPCNSRKNAFTTATDSLSFQDAIRPFPDGSGSRRSPRLIRCKAAARYPNFDPGPPSARVTRSPSATARAADRLSPE